MDAPIDVIHVKQQQEDLKFLSHFGGKFIIHQVQHMHVHACTCTCACSTACGPSTSQLFTLCVIVYYTSLNGVFALFIYLFVCLFVCLTVSGSPQR